MKKLLVYFSSLLLAAATLSSCNRGTDFNRLPGKGDSPDEIASAVSAPQFKAPLLVPLQISTARKAVPPPLYSEQDIHDAMAAFREVLLARDTYRIQGYYNGSSYYCDVESGLFLTLDQWFEYNSVHSAEATSFALFDLDGDGLLEVILNMDVLRVKDAASLILRYEDGVVRGYHFAPRAFGDLKVDGTFWFSNGAFDHGFAKMDFSDSSHYWTKDVCYSKSTDYDEDGNFQICYYYDGNRITEEAFQQYIQTYDDTEDVTYMDFTRANIKALFPRV